MFSLLLHCTPEQAELLASDIWLMGAEGAVEEPGALRVFFAGDARAAQLIARWAAYSPEFRHEPVIDYAAATRASFPPLEIGRSFFLVPPWNVDPAPAGRLRLVVEPGMACGTGWHACTRLCLEAMEDVVAPGASFLDVGCGSGILSEAARLLGAVRIAACDIDEDALRIARSHYAVESFVGSSVAVRARSFDVLAANIGAAAVGELAPWAARVAPLLILSGFTETEVPDLPLAIEQRLTRDGWCCLICRTAS